MGENVAKKRKTRRDKGIMTVDKQARSLLPYFYRPREANKGDAKAIAKSRIGTNKEFSEALGVSPETYKRLCIKLREIEGENDKLKFFFFFLTISGLKGMLKLVKTRKEELKRSGRISRKPRVTKKVKLDQEKAEMYAKKKKDMQARWDDWG